MSSTDVSPCPTPVGTPLSTHAPKYGTVIPNRIFVGGITTSTTEAELKAFFTAYGAVKDTKIIADRGGVSKGYGFVTFENQEDAERIIKKEADNLIFKDRKLNIGPAIRKQVHMSTQLLTDIYSQGTAEQISPRSFGDPNLSPGTLLFTNGVPYTYQNGMAIFHAPEGGYPIPQPQPSYSAAAVMVPQPPPLYMAPQYSAYQPGTPQWSTAAQWRWAAQSPGQSVTSTPSYVFAALPPSPELMYAQPPPPAYQPTDIGDATVIEAPPVEGSVEQTGGSSRMYVTDPSATDQSPVTTVYSVQTPQAKPAAPYRKPVTSVPRRSYSSPTVLVKHGHKIQRLMAKPSSGTVHPILHKHENDAADRHLSPSSTPE